ncbi:hypothetical protein QUF90_12305, partial [Desulfococcaceae bacterium HSG9]|nr:hypothetical protein [Desulfococcaceae bacterium HSG9]
MQGDLYQVDKEPLLNLPFLNPSVEVQNKIALFVSQIISNKQKEIDYLCLLEEAKEANNFDREIQLSKALEKISQNILKFESDIDVNIYKLYDLTDEEIKIVESET